MAREIEAAERRRESGVTFRYVNVQDVERSGTAERVECLEIPKDIDGQPRNRGTVEEWLCGADASGERCNIEPGERLEENGATELVGIGMGECREHGPAEGRGERKYITQLK